MVQLRKQKFRIDSARAPNSPSAGCGLQTGSLHDLLHSSKRVLTTRAVDVQVGDEAHELSIHSAGENVAFSQFLREVAAEHASAADIEDQDVGLSLRGIDLDPRRSRQTFGEKLSVGVIFVEALRPFLQRD